MLTRFFFSSLILFYSFGATAAKIEGVFHMEAGIKTEIELYEVMPMGNANQPLIQKTQAQNNRFELQFKLRKPAFFHLYILTGEGDHRSRYATTVYLTPKSTLKLRFRGDGENKINCDYDAIRNADNRSLVGMQERFNDQLRDYFYNPPANVEHAVTHVNRFSLIKDSLLARTKVSAIVRKYIDFKTAESTETSIYQYLAEKKNAAYFAPYFSDKIQTAYYADPFRLLFPESIQNLVNYLTLKHSLRLWTSLSLDEIQKLADALHTMNINQQIRDYSIERMLQRFKSRYKSTGNFSEDKTRFNAVANKISNEEIATSIREEFMSLEYTLPGANFPAVRIVDTKGNTFSPEKYKGKYIFVDLWASWCIPCIRMTPYVQQLEKEFPDIVFVAISIDSDKEDWVKKSAELKLEGLQFWDEEKQVSKVLNISGIPHYLIYDKEGKLMEYKTPMPSSPELKKLLETLK